MIDITIKNIYCGSYYTVIYKENGDVLIFGSLTYENRFLGNVKPLLLMNDLNIKEISCGGTHIFIYKYNGDLLVFGSNKHGQLGLNNFNIINTPTLLMNNIRIKNIICGPFHTILYKDNGDLLIFGKNCKYFFGAIDTVDNDNADLNIPTLLMNDKKIVSINGTSIFNKWSIENYRYLSIFEQQEIKTFYLCLKYIQNQTQLKIPKFIIYEILKCL